MCPLVRIGVQVSVRRLLRARRSRLPCGFALVPVSATVAALPGLEVIFLFEAMQ